MGKTEEIASYNMEVYIKFHPVAQEILVSNNFRDKESNFYEYCHWEVNHTPAEGYTSKKIWIEQIWLDG